MPNCTANTNLSNSGTHATSYLIKDNYTIQGRSSIQQFDV